ncbi:Ribonuclease MRP protein subunit rmp1 [Exophiala xenobiotica]|nr:Ribonuclease MRP protein subunit rmp1 [Exophiala xenobiotica]KAK5271166.1 Ribonuclease MRP protein subunit rmp1 [Exophiala xenobiotica]KAK5342400.1 Ribonuclease MRP protein subunit rmp1 [Exophiala xenobiotica]KAK5440253.1 Ribonuclease MRP protein subunit rmp1 [Exophiala xenobiotica]
MSVQKTKDRVTDKRDASEGVPGTSSKRRKISHPSQTPKFQTRYNEKATKRLQRRWVLPQPPRSLRPHHLSGVQASSDAPTKLSLSASQPNSKPNSGTSTPLPIADPSSKLPFMKTLLDQIWARNKNQHRTQPWWKLLGILRKAITQLAILDERQSQLRQQATGTGTGAGIIDAKTVRKRFEQEAQIRRERDVCNERIREVLVPRCYVGFTGLVADKQFANLGVVLVGVLADVMSVVGPPTPSKEENTSTSAEGDRENVKMKMKMNGKPTSLTVTATSLRITGLQSGQLVERMYDSDDAGEVVERSKKEDETQIPSDQTPRPRPTSTSTRPRPKSIDGTAADAHQSDLTELATAKDKEGVDTDGNQAAEQGSQSRQAEAPALSALDATTPQAESSLRSDLTSEPRKSTSRSRDRPTSDTSKTGKGKEKKRKKGTRNAIDDLFAGLS